MDLEDQWWITDERGQNIAQAVEASGDHEEYIHYNGETVALIMQGAVEEISHEFEICIHRLPKREELIRILRYVLDRTGVSNECK